MYPNLPKTKLNYQLLGGRSVHLRRKGGLSGLRSLEVVDKSKRMLRVANPFNIETNYLISYILLFSHTFLWICITIIQCGFLINDKNGHLMILNLWRKRMLIALDYMSKYFCIIMNL